MTEMQERNSESKTLMIGGVPFTHEEYYNQLTVSASAFVTSETQERLRRAQILVAGVGSIGNPIAMMAVRSGAENVTVMDPGDIEVSNFPRQNYTIEQIGMNKAQATVSNMLSINPFASESIQSVPEGMTLSNVREYVEKADIVVDGVDIRALDVIYALHKCAAELKKPVLVGYDLAGTAMIAVYRYDLENIKPLKGELTEEKIEEFSGVQAAYTDGLISESAFLDYVYDAFTGPIKPLDVPIEQLEEILGRDDSVNRTFQIGTTSTVLSALAVEAMRRILVGEKVRDTIIVDLPSEVRRKSSNPKVLQKIPLLLRTLKVLNERGERVKKMLSDI